VRSGLRRSSGVLRSGRAGVLRSGSFDLLRSQERLLRQRRRDVRLVQEAVRQGSRLRPLALVLLCSGSDVLRSGSDLRRSLRSGLRRSVRCVQLV
jgi:hypothetical protein